MLIFCRYRLLFLTLLVTSSVFAQSFIQTSSVSNNRYVINPAYAGMTGSMELNALYRSQWQGGTGTPQNFMVNLHSPLYPAHGGVGIQVRSDQIGNRTVVDAGLSYNYVMETDALLLSLGSALSYRRASFDPTSVTTPDGDYISPFVFSNDDELIQSFSEGSVGIFPGFFGAYEDLEFGLSYEKYFASESQHLLLEKGTFHAFVDYIFTLPNGIEMESFAHLKNQSNQTQADFYVSGLYNQRILLGTGLRGYSGKSLDAMTINIGFRFTRELSMAYYYDVGLSSYAKQLDGSHEILLKYHFKNNIFESKRVKRIYNPRFVD